MELNLSRKNLTQLPNNLPQNLQQLYCYNNQLTTLPNHLPVNLQILYCGSNRLTSLPNNLPRNLQQLDCGNNQLTTLPKHLPVNLLELYCHGNQLTSLPNHLPNNLQRLDCHCNEITEITNFPKSLTYFNYDQLKRVNGFELKTFRVKPCDNLQQFIQELNKRELKQIKIVQNKWIQIYYRAKHRDYTYGINLYNGLKEFQKYFSV